MSNLKSGPQFAQGEGRARSSKRSGSHLDQGTHGARSKGPSGSHLLPDFTITDTGGSHLDPHPALTDKTSDRGGGGRIGHDRTNPVAGKSKSGSKNAQHPNNKKG